MLRGSLLGCDGDGYFRSVASTAVIVIDMLNPYEHEDAEPLMASVQRVLPQLRGLIDSARSRDIEIVYVNDNHGDWSAGRAELVARALAGKAPDLVEPIVPPEDLPFVVKARHSIFYETLLEYMLRQSGVDRIMLSGQVTEQCILYSALDGYVRHFNVVVCRECVAHINEDLADAALSMMERNMHAEVALTVEEALRLL
jgi:nicotinamidase-related amidase